MTTTVMYNACFGGFGFSKEAIRLYNQRYAESPEILMQTSLETGWDISRTDPVMIQVVRELGPRANSLHSRIRLEEIPSQYANYYSITEYDGNETVHIHYEQYAIECIEAVMNNSNLPMAAKITSIRHVLREHRAIRDATPTDDVQIRSTVGASERE
jgi:hypothetical protein